VVRTHQMLTHPTVPQCYHSFSNLIRGTAGEGPSYTLEAWHERLGFQRSPVEIRAGETAAIELEFVNPWASARD